MSMVYTVVRIVIHNPASNVVEVTTVMPKRWEALENV
jgi:hypothetical protein